MVRHVPTGDFYATLPTRLPVALPPYDPFPPSWAYPLVLFPHPLLAALAHLTDGVAHGGNRRDHRLRKVGLGPSSSHRFSR